MPETALRLPASPMLACASRRPPKRLAWVIDTAKRHGIQLVVAGRNGALYEQHRADFAAAGITLVTGD